MAENIRLYGGTQEGLLIWRATGSRWQEFAHEFRDGIIDSITGSRTNPEVVYLGVTHDGLYRTDDGGRHWRKVIEGDIRSVSVDPTDDDVLYTGTEPVHLYRSEDRGETWEELPALLDLPQEVRKRWTYPREPHEAHIRHIFIHPDDPNLLYLCLEHGGIVRSYDRGKTWEDVTGGIDYPDIHVLSNLPRHFDRYYVATARGFFTADDPAGGWKRAEKGLTRDYFHDLLFLPPKRPAENSTMLIATADKSPGFWDREKRGARAAVFRSLDCARSWERVGQGLPEELDPMVWALVPHPHDENAVFAGLGQVARGHAHGAAMAPKGSILLSRDRGDSWQHLPIDLPADRVLYAAGE